MMIYVQCVACKYIREGGYDWFRSDLWKNGTEIGYMIVRETARKKDDTDSIQVLGMKQKKKGNYVDCIENC